MWCTSLNMLVSAAHIPGTQNTEGDSFSRNFYEAIEWNFKYVWKHNIRPFCLLHRLPN